LELSPRVSDSSRREIPGYGKVDEAGETAITKILLKEIVDERLTRCESHGNEGFE